MTERRVSVRLAAVGGQAVKNELREIGRDGAQAFQQLERASGGGRAAVQNFAFQVQDFAVQVAGGTAASRALAQQLPQLLGGFGVMGAVVGAAVAVLVPLGASLFDAADGTAKLIEEMASATGSISAVEGAISALEGTQRAYTEAIAASGGASSAAAALVISNSAAEFEARKSLLSLEIELLRIRGLEQAADQANLQAGIDRARQGVNDRVSNIAYQNNRAYYGGVDRAGNTLDAYVNTRAGEAAIAGTTPDMIVQYQQDLAEFEEATKLDRMALQKVTAERTLSELALERAEGLLDTKFEDLATGGAPAGGTGTSTGGGRRGGGAGRAAADGMDQAAEATERAKTALESYAESAMKSGEGIQSALAGAFTSAESALRDFITTGKVDFRSFVTSIIADLAMVGARRFILGPLANALGGALGGLGGGGGFFGKALASVLHDGGIVGAGGSGRMVPALAFAGAPRFHDGGGFGLRSDEQAAILQRGERVLSRAQNRAWEGGAGAQINIYARDAQSFRQSRTQVAADIARAVSAGRRGL
jgi:hypothetical protein